MFPYGVAGLPPRRKLEAQTYRTGDPPAGAVQVTNLVTSAVWGFSMSAVIRLSLVKYPNFPVYSPDFSIIFYEIYSLQSQSIGV